MEQQGLKRTLTPLMLWGLGVGYVISGMYFGWNLGLEKGGTWGLAIATLFIVIMYTAFTFSYTELACAIPKAGGGFDYTTRALGKKWGFIAGIAQIIEFTFAPPAIAFAIGAYFNLFLPEVPVLYIAITSYIIFTALNISGIKAAALFELVITILAVGELLLFAGLISIKILYPMVGKEYLQQYHLRFGFFWESRELLMLQKKLSDPKKPFLLVLALQSLH